MARVIGITGSIGSGKTAVGKILESTGLPVIDTDLIVHELLENRTPVQKAVLERFGKEVESGSSGVDRAKLGAIVFEDERARRDLEAIIHPAVLLEMRRRIQSCGTSPLVAVLVPLLFEAGISREFDEVWTVIAEEKTLRSRLAIRDSMSDDQIAKRLTAQMGQQEKASKSHHVIDNSGSLDNTRRQLELLVSKYR